MPRSVTLSGLLGALLMMSKPPTKSPLAVGLNCTCRSQLADGASVNGGVAQLPDVPRVVTNEKGGNGSVMSLMSRPAEPVLVKVTTSDWPTPSVMLPKFTSPVLNSIVGSILLPVKLTVSGLVDASLVTITLSEAPPPSVGENVNSSVQLAAGAIENGAAPQLPPLIANGAFGPFSVVTSTETGHWRN